MSRAEEIINKFLSFCAKIGGKPHRRHMEAICTIPKDKIVNIIVNRGTSIHTNKPYARLDIAVGESWRKEFEHFMEDAERIILDGEYLDTRIVEIDVSINPKPTYEGSRVVIEKKPLRLTLYPMMDGKQLSLKILELPE